MTFKKLKQKVNQKLHSRRPERLECLYLENTYLKLERARREYENFRRNNFIDNLFLWKAMKIRPVVVADIISPDEVKSRAKFFNDYRPTVVDLRWEP